MLKHWGRCGDCHARSLVPNRSHRYDERPYEQYSRSDTNHTNWKHVEHGDLLVYSGGNTDGVQGGHEECQKRLKFSMAERVKRAHLNRVLPSSTELKRQHMRMKRGEPGDTPNRKDIVTS